MRRLSLVLLACALSAPAVRAQEDQELSAEEPRRLLLTAWGGEAFGTTAARSSGASLGGEFGWAFDALDVSVAGYGQQNLSGSTGGWSPILLLRLTERFETRRGFDAALSLGIGGARSSHWEAYFQVALGVRVPLGPLFLAGELAFEQNDAFRAAAGLGVRL